MRTTRPPRPWTYARLADMLSGVFGIPIRTNQVYMWYHRRGRNGFPEAVGTAEHPDGRLKGSPVFDPDAVLNWYINYEPNKGGAPLGNHNGGTREERQSRARRQAHVRQLLHVDG